MHPVEQRAVCSRPFMLVEEDRDLDPADWERGTRDCITGLPVHDPPMRWFLLVMLLLVAHGRLFAADPPVDGGKSSPALDRSLTSLKSVIEPLTGANEELDKLRRELKQAATEEAKQGIQIRIDAERERVRQLRGNFRDILGGAEAAEYEGGEPAETGLQQQISELVQPMLGELRQATSGPREMEELRKSLDTWTERKRKSDIIVARIQELSTRNKDKALVSELDSAKRFWESRQAEAAGQIEVISAQITDRERQQKPLWETLSLLFSQFFRSRGLNLLLALLAGVSGFVIVRRIYSSLRRYSPVHRHGKGSLTSRISDILAMALAILIATLGILLVFYIRGDWLLLTLVVVLLIGGAWAGKAALPPYIDQIRMLLNLGSVREDERVVHLGLPWRVASIGFFTTLTNPNLQGGVLRIPIRDLMGMTSRDPDPKEPWFPTEEDDWVVLADGTYGKTITQTPEQVVVLQLGGSLKTYPTTDFLAQAPENLSRGFRISSVFGIDYQHQAEATGSVPGILENALTNALVADFGRELVRSVKVEFTSAAASSLDYQINVDFDGSLGSRYKALQRRIQHLCVETCNVEGWVIPFTQITVHQGSPGKP